MPASPPTLARRAFLCAAGALGLAGCSGVSVLNALAGSGHRRQEGVAYGADPRQRLDVYLPDTVVAATPLVVFFYGGSWSSGERADYGFVGESLASGGVAVAVADYRLSPAVRWQQILADCAAATRWAFDQAPALGLNRRNLYLMGHSAGGYNAAMLALDARWLSAAGLAPAQLAGWVGLAGPYDFLPIVNPEARVAFDWPHTPPDSQPIAHAGGRRSRALLLAPTEDTVVNPVRSTQGLARRLEAAGTPVRHRLLDGVGHGTIVGALAPPLRRLAPVRDEVLAFLRNEPPPA
ncbi:alpha/beta hydrolase [Caenimonas sedimenti]|uniref:Alpha/beta hydrolase n=1 Tax=Caenimonas sedimenti TaxID=2596921 RepID=A0A562ZXZ7_9BURK|nr:alpha/beta hydrolase [Caenimonas sedimenti]TWO73208.1 alpha/beta hydrolase [Caenimonas sedimenti]